VSSSELADLHWLDADLVLLPDLHALLVAGHA
jgi:hypothetical protein